MTVLRHRLAMGALLAAAAWLGVAATAQTASPSGSAPSTASRASAAAQGQRADSATAEGINAKLMASNTLRPLDLGIWVHGGTATLTGAVPTQELPRKPRTW